MGRRECQREGTLYDKEKRLKTGTLKQNYTPGYVACVRGREVQIKKIFVWHVKEL